METVELQSEYNENNDEIFNHKLFEASSTCIPGSLSSVASCVRSNLVDTAEKVILKQAWKFSSFFLLLLLRYMG